MPSNFRIESFEPKEIEKAQKVIDAHLNEILGIQSKIEIEKKELFIKSFANKLIHWFTKNINIKKSPLKRSTKLDREDTDFDTIG